MSSQAEKTEQPTHRRRTRARDEGQFAYSKELTAAMTLAVGLTVAVYTMDPAGSFRSMLETALQVMSKGPESEQLLPELMDQIGVAFLWIVAPVLGAVVLASLAGNVVQGLPIFASEKPLLKWDTLNPVQGLSRLKTKVSVTEWLKLLILVSVIGAILWSTLQAFWGRLVSMPASDIQSSNELLIGMVTRMVAYIAVAALVLAVGDFFLQRWKFEKGIRQTKNEVKDDMKAADGNPAIKGKIRSIQRERARRRMMARVKDADVIITNPTHYAVALEYKPGVMSAPRVVAKGQDWVAQKIKAVGRENDIPTVENVPLARALYASVELEQEIPIDLYKAVAEVLAFVFRQGKR